MTICVYTMCSIIISEVEGVQKERSQKECVNQFRTAESTAMNISAFFSVCDVTSQGREEMQKKKQRMKIRVK